MFNLFTGRRSRRVGPEDPLLLQKAERFEPLVHRAIQVNAKKFAVPFKMVDDKAYLGPSPGFPGGVYYWRFRFGDHRGLLTVPFSWEVEFHVEPTYYKVVLRSGSLGRMLPVPEGWYTVRSSDDEMRIKFEEPDGITFPLVILGIHNVIEGIKRIG